MRKTMLSMLLVWLLAAACGLPALQAAEPSQGKPVAVVGVACYDELMADLDYVGKISGQPQVAMGVKGALAFITQGKGLAGLDKSRPLGAVIHLDGENPTGFAFVPVTDLDKLHDVFKPFIGEVTELDGGVWKVEGKEVPDPAFVKEAEGGWLLVSDKPQNLAGTTADPGKLLDGITEKYDLAVRLFVCNVPQQQRQKLLADIKEDAQREMKRKDGEDEQEFIVRRIFISKLLEAATAAINEIEHVTFGWSLDRKAQNASFEAAVTALADSQAAACLAKLGQAKTDFAGFRLPQAAVSAVGTVECPVGSRDRQDLAAVIGAVRAKAFELIEAREKNAERAQAAKNLVAGLLEVAEGTIASGRADGGMAVVLKQGVTLAAGRYIADGKKLEETLGQLVEAVRKEHPDFVDKVLETDVIEHNGVSYHVVSLPIPQGAGNREKLVQALGDPLVIVVGIGPQKVYLSAGKLAKQVLKEVVLRSEAAGPQSTAPMELSVSVGRIAKMVAAVAEGRQQAVARRVAEALADADGNDHVNVTVLPIDRGAKLRIEAEQGVLKLLGSVRPPR